MGITIGEGLALRDAVRAGTPLGRMLTLGRQWLLTDRRELAQVLDAPGVTPAAREQLLAAPPAWADGLFHALGAVEVTAMDVSDYEGATVIQDLNAPIPDALAGGFDFVLDGGTSEHVFDVAQVFRNLMRLPRIGGHVLVCVPANNQFGHGFYQFSPELFYRVFAPENGYEVVQLLLTERWTGRRYEAVDPAKVGQRIEMFGTAPLLGLTCLARRVLDVPPFARPPVQSDYAAAWAVGAHAGTPPRGSRIRRGLVRQADRWFPSLLRYVRRRRSLDLKWHPALFRRLDD